MSSRDRTRRIGARALQTPLRGSSTPAFRHLGRDEPRPSWWCRQTLRCGDGDRSHNCRTRLHCRFDLCAILPSGDGDEYRGSILRLAVPHPSDHGRIGQSSSRVSFHAVEHPLERSTLPLPNRALPPQYCPAGLEKQIPELLPAVPGSISLDAGRDAHLELTTEEGRRLSPSGNGRGLTWSPRAFAPPGRTGPAPARPNCAAPMKGVRRPSHRSRVSARRSEP